MADPVRYELDDGSTVSFDSADGNLVSLRGGEPEVVDAGRLGNRLQHIAGEAGIWFFSQVSGEGSISVPRTWKRSPSP